MTTFAALMDGPRDLGPGSGPPPLPGPSTSTLPPTTAPHRRRSLVSAWTANWWAVALRGLDLFVSIAGLVLMGLAIGGFFSLTAAGTGVLILTPALWGAWALGRGQRHLLLAFTGVDIGTPVPSAAPQWRRVLGLDQPRLRAIGWAALQGLWGVLASAVVLFLLTLSLLLLAAPLLGRWAEDGLQILWFARPSGTLGHLLVSLIGLVLLLALPFLARGAANVDIALARWLVGSDPQAELRVMSERVETLTTTRTEAVDSVEAERRRIERDLHDGPQQRLVSIAMTLGLARTQLDSDPEGARALLDEAHSASKEAIVEMRQVARGIVPPILADRGLDAAVSALAARSPVPVEVTSRLQQRLEPTVEAIAYFCISEALTNVAKHAGASRVTVDLGLARTLAGDQLAVRVVDDGRGGAVVGAGTGLTGLRQRVASVDGDVHVHSPVGGGTTVAITLPLRTRSTS
ncbi:histidine kinase [Ornithinimicrobium cerasi]|uniref:histidine kinase n=1 Tax=Ornithinimicrobium cerasi TaxID=2248773 RepID=UPI000F004AFA|nr:histidine kinase [Ornithinimicrobium cerasi]